MDPAHDVEELYQCTQCGSTDKKKQLVLTLQHSIPYADSIHEGGMLSCAGNRDDCTAHLFMARHCGHVLCSGCLRRGVAHVLPKPTSTPEEFDGCARSFLSDVETFIVPPCPVCAGARKPRRETGEFDLQTLRSLPPDLFNLVKSVGSGASPTRG